MPRSRTEPLAEVLPEMVAGLDLLRSALLALDAAALSADRANAVIEAARTSRSGVVPPPGAEEERDRWEAAARREFALSRLDPPDPVEDAAVVHGRIVDLEGAAGSGVTVFALDEAGETLAKTTTDDQGHYVLRIAGTEERRVRLEVRRGKSVLAAKERLNRVQPGRVGFDELAIDPT
jgi:hypothetical protein